MSSDVVGYEMYSCVTSEPAPLPVLVSFSETLMLISFPSVVVGFEIFKSEYENDVYESPNLWRRKFVVFEREKKKRSSHPKGHRGAVLTF